MPVDRAQKNSVPLTRTQQPHTRPSRDPARFTKRREYSACTRPRYTRGKAHVLVGAASAGLQSSVSKRLERPYSSSSLAAQCEELDTVSLHVSAHNRASAARLVLQRVQVDRRPAGPAAAVPYARREPRYAGGCEQRRRPLPFVRAAARLCDGVQASRGARTARGWRRSR